MDLGSFTPRDEAANKLVRLYPARDAILNGGTYAPPCVDVDGVQVSLYVQDGVLVVSVDPEAAGDAFRRYGDGLVPVVVDLNGETVFEATGPGHVKTIDVLVRAERPRRTVRNLWGLLG